MYPKTNQNYTYWVYKDDSKAWTTVRQFYDNQENEKLSIWPVRNCREIKNISKSFGFQSKGSVQEGYHLKIDSFSFARQNLQSL